MASIPTPTDLTTFTVEVAGQALPGTYSVIAIDVHRAANHIPTATLILNDGDAAAQDFAISSDELLKPGQEIEIKAGYSRQEDPIFKGIITTQRVEVRRRGDSRLLVEARDPAFRMTLARLSAYRTDLTDSDLFEELIGLHSGLTAQVEATTTQHPEVVQYQVTDWDFLVSRAEHLGMLCFCEDGTVRAAKPDPNQSPALTLTYGQGIFDLDLELDARTQQSQVTASAWDPGSQEILESEVDDAAAPAQGDLKGPDLAQIGGVEELALRHTGALKQEELDAWAQAQMLKSRFSKIRGTVRCQGTAQVKPGDLVEIDGLGDRFNGAAFVAGVRHALGRGDWETTLQLGLDPRWHYQLFPVDAKPAAGFNPPISGLQIGVVTQLEGDPLGEDRIRVRVPVISPEDSGTWARLATLDAGENRGTFFRPEVNDEVVVGFLSDDPHQAIVLGMLHSSAKPAPVPASDDNHEKGLVTRSGIKILFDDDKVSLTIETPNGNRVELSDDQGHILIEDETGNSVKLSSDGIVLDSPADIQIKAGRNVNIEGTNVSLKASASMKAEGSASADFSSSGTTSLKGSLVNIN